MAVATMSYCGRWKKIRISFSSNGHRGNELLDRNKRPNSSTLKKYNEKEYLWVIEHVQPYGLTLIMTYDDDNGNKN